MAIRDEFPILAREVNGKPLVYLDNAATTQKPAIVIEAMNDYYSNYNSNVHRAVHTLAGEATESYEKCRTLIKQRYNAPRVVLTSGTTESINLVAHAWARANLSSGDVVLLTEMEHHSDIVPWQMLSKDIGVELRYVPLNDDFTLDMEAFHSSLDGVRLICVVHTSNVLGIRNPIEEIIQAAKKIGAKVSLDAAQALPHTIIDFENSGADFMAFSAHKMCGPTGIGALLINEDSFAEMQPFLGGGDMIEKVSLSGSTYQENEHRFEAGTPRIAEAIGWAAALDWMNTIDLHSEHVRLVKIANSVANSLDNISGITVFNKPSGSDAALVSFLHESIHPEDMARFLDASGFAVRTGHHCAQPLMERMGVKGTIRASFYLYNTQEEADDLIAKISEIVERFA